MIRITPNKCSGILVNEVTYSLVVATQRLQYSLPLIFQLSINKNFIGFLSRQRCGLKDLPTRDLYAWFARVKVCKPSTRQLLEILSLGLKMIFFIVKETIF